MIQDIQNPVILLLFTTIFIVGFISGFIVGRKKERTDIVKKSDLFASAIAMMWLAMHGYRFYIEATSGNNIDMPFMFDIVGVACISHIIGENFSNSLKEIINSKLGKK